MKPEEIREIAVDSANVYYEYLDHNDKGIQEVDVFEIEYISSKDVIIKLRLSAKLFDTEAIFFKLLKNNKKYDSSEVKVIEYDNDKNILLIKPIEAAKADFNSLSNHDIKVISDLKFLVKRVKSWFELNGGKISLPTEISKYSKHHDKIEFFKEKHFHPSDNQIKSLENIFSKPFTYVWGAPGTGKTQFVLAYSVLHYIKNGDKIAILAPTNNAIEQVLRGVIKMTDKAIIDRKQIIRLGTPSKKFADAYPEVCEEKGALKKMQEIDNQIDILERMLNFQNLKQLVHEAQNYLNEIDNMKILTDNIKKEQASQNLILDDIKKKEIEINLFNEELLKKSSSLEKTINRTNLLPHKFIKFFSSHPTSLENSIKSIESQILQIQKEFEFSKYQLVELSKQNVRHQKNLKQLRINLKSKIKILEKKTQANPEICEIISKVTEENIIEIKEKLILLFNQKTEQANVDEHLFNEYKDTYFDIETDLKNYKSLRDKLAQSTTDERLKTVNVIACTLDGYIGRYTESKLPVDHIFLDEAGYANIIKALTLFNHTTPVTFLGDHKQLPPVCEINDVEMGKDIKFQNMFLWAQSAIFLDNLFSNSKEFCRTQYLNNVEFSPVSISKTSLNSTYRFGKNLANILAKYVYSEEFNSVNAEGETKIYYLNAKKTEGPKSRISLNEVLEIQKMVEKLKNNSMEDFVILTPYKKQVKLLGNYLPKERNELKILTVHGSQGREWETVILSVVDTYDKWFVDTTKPISKGLNLMNTAVSRAKKGLIIVCDKNYWSDQPGQLITELIKCGVEAKI